MRARRTWSRGWMPRRWRRARAARRRLRRPWRRRGRSGTRPSVATAASAGGPGAADRALAVGEHVLFRLALLRLRVELHDLVRQQLALVGLDRPLGDRAAAKNERPQ